MSKFWTFQQPEAEGDQSANVADSQTAAMDRYREIFAGRVPDRRSRARFRRRTESETYSLDPSLLLSSVTEAAPAARAHTFAELAERERLDRMVRRHLAAHGIDSF